MARDLYIVIFLLVVLSACNTTKYLKPGQKLFTGSKVKVTDKDLKKNEAGDLQDEMEKLIRPQPNSKLLGIRFKLWLYDRYYTNKKKGLKHFLMSKGEPPVLISSVDVEQNSNIMQNRLQ